MKIFSLSGSYEKPVGESHPEMASVGLHQFLFDLIIRLRPAKFSALDLGAGSGAWGQRLINAGHSAKGIVRASDLEACSLECVTSDLNLPFADRFKEKFDVLTCFEVLEHLENPRNVFREGRKLIKEDGILVISTPNASGLYSRVKFFITGRFGMFDDFQYEDIGHITPLTHWQLEKMFAENDFEIVVLEDFDASPRRISTLGDLLKKLTWIVRPFLRGHVGTQHIIMAGRPKNVLPQPA